MRKAILVLAILIILFSATTALAADGEQASDSTWLNIDWSSDIVQAVAGGAIGAVIAATVITVRKRRAKKQEQIDENQDKGENDGL